MNQPPTYIAQTGSYLARDRLALQHRVFSPGTERLLVLSHFRPDMRVLIIGCGCGDETIMIAKKMNDVGHMVAIDISAEQLAEAKTAAEREGQSKKIKFKNKSIEDINEEDGKFDLILGRFILPHLKNLKETIERLKERLNPQGKIASQEPIVSSCYAKPKSESLKKYLDLMMTFGHKNGLDFNMAKTIPSLFASCGLETKSEHWQPEVFGADKRLVAMSAVECLPAIQKAGLVDEKTANAIIEGIETEVVKPDETILVQCENVLTVGFIAPCVSDCSTSLL